MRFVRAGETRVMAPSRELVETVVACELARYVVKGSQ